MPEKRGGYVEHTSTLELSITAWRCKDGRDTTSCTLLPLWRYVVIFPHRLRYPRKKKRPVFHCKGKSVYSQKGLKAETKGAI